MLRFHKYVVMVNVIVAIAIIVKIQNSISTIPIELDLTIYKGVVTKRFI